MLLSRQSGSGKRSMAVESTNNSGEWVYLLIGTDSLLLWMSKIVKLSLKHLFNYLKRVLYTEIQDLLTGLVT